GKRGKPRLRHPGLSLVRRAPAWAAHRGSAAQTRRSVPSALLSPRRDLARLGARWTHSTSLVRVCQVTESSDLHSARLTQKFAQPSLFRGTVPLRGLRGGQVCAMLSAP